MIWILLNESNSSLTVASTTPKPPFKISTNSLILALVILVPFSNTTSPSSLQISSANVWSNNLSATLSFLLNL